MGDVSLVGAGTDGGPYHEIPIQEHKFTITPPAGDVVIALARSVTEQARIVTFPCLSVGYRPKREKVSSAMLLAEPITLSY